MWFDAEVENLEYATASPTLFGHPNATGANAVGAAPYFGTPAFGTEPPVLEPFSSAGGIPILFDTGGDRTQIMRRKPEFTAPDGVNTTFFGNDYEPDGWPNFFGTSAAAPHAAAVAALLREVRPTSTPMQIREALTRSAVDIGERGTASLATPGIPIGPGFDNDSGAGLLDARSAVARFTQPSPIPGITAAGTAALAALLGLVGVSGARRRG
jgi:subtilisin family serine protease